MLVKVLSADVQMSHHCLRAAHRLRCGQRPCGVRPTRIPLKQGKQIFDPVVFRFVVINFPKKNKTSKQKPTKQTTTT